ncbi:methyltransferase domain protein [Ceratobasidium sp. AG-Ba]|nr:methyltransferase domain protein [Ceratobasidium sp. AG-Ba]
MIQDAFHDPDTGSIIYWVRPHVGEEAECSDEEGSDSGDSMSSDDTITSSEARDYFYEFNGRLFVDSPDVPIWYPADMEQKSGASHQLYKLVYGGNYFGPMSQVLCSWGESRPRVLEMCTQDGSWVQEMSQEFPNVDFVSLDVAPMVHHIPRKNIIFEVYDIQHEILEPDESFDLVRMAYTSEMLKDIRTLITEAQRVLKPGGLLCIFERELAVYDSKDLSRPSESTPWTNRVVDAMRSSLLLQGAQIETWRLMEDWLASDSGLWDDRGSSTPPFERITKGLEVVHAGGWDADFSRQGIRLLMAQLATVTLRNMGPMLSLTKMDSRNISQLVDNAIEEVRDLRTQYALKLHHLFAYKPLTPCC